VIERRAAAQAMGNLVKVSSQLIKGRTATAGVEVPGGQAVAVARIIVPAAGPGVGDADAEVRRLSVRALRESAAALRERVGDARLDIPQGRELTDEEKKDLKEYQDAVKEEWEELKPLADALRGEGKDLIAAVNDPDPQVSIGASRTLEEIGLARQRLQRRAETAQLPAVGTSEVRRPADLADRRNGELLAEADSPATHKKPLAYSLEVALPALTRALRDPDARARRQAAEALESMGEEAAPAVPALIRALDDPDLFVRWIAVRTLGKLGPKTSASAIPAIGRLLSDPDLDVEVQAATVLGLFEGAAEQTVPDLIAAIRAGDATLTIAAIKALMSINKRLDEVVPAVIEVLSVRDARARRQAAEALSRFGPAARSAADALRARLNDPDPEVRKAVADALLSITGHE
jgi:HEAT repeat protein